MSANYSCIQNSYKLYKHFSFYLRGKLFNMCIYNTENKHLYFTPFL